MDLPPIVAPDLAWKDGSLTYCGTRISDLVAMTGTPAFVYSQPRLEANLRLFLRVFGLPSPWRLRLAYSAKTAWEPRLLRVLAQLGVGAEVACGHELELCLGAGFAPEGIVLDGPALAPDLLARAISRGVRLIKVDSREQLQLVADQAAKGPELGVCLRLKAPGARLPRRPTDILERRFGLGEEDLERCLVLLKGKAGLAFRGLGVHIGSQVTNPGEYRRALVHLAGAWSRIRERGLRGDLVDLGGGFPSPSLGPPSVWGHLKSWVAGRGRAVPEIERYGQEVSGVVREHCFPPEVTELILEPGRAITGNAAVLLTRVVAVKDGWLILDASRNFVPESLFFAARRFLPAEYGSQETWKRVHLAGSTLSGGDVLALATRLPTCQAGDLLLMMDAGAYTLARASRFTTLIPPAYLLDKEGGLGPLRRKEAVEDVVREALLW